VVHAFLFLSTIVLYKISSPPPIDHSSLAPKPPTCSQTGSSAVTKPLERTKTKLSARYDGKRKKSAKRAAAYA